VIADEIAEALRKLVVAVEKLTVITVEVRDILKGNA
jgi:hypothetical protein